MEQEWRQVAALARTLRGVFGEAPEVALVLGSGLGSLADQLNNRKTIENRRIDGFPRSTIEGHAGLVHTGTLGTTSTLVFQGRAHLYEGYGAAEVVRPVRAAVSWGASKVILTNAAGGIDQELVPGQLMVIEDHLNLTGTNPLIGPNDDELGPRFPDMTELYDSALRKEVLGCAASNGIALGSGVYAGLTGPSYETPAEVRMLARLGADAVGMSTVLEAIAARHLGARVLALSCITNRAAGTSDAPLDHDEVQRAGAKASGELTRLLSALLEGEGAD